MNLLPAVVRQPSGDLSLIDPESGEVVDLAAAPLDLIARYRAALVDHDVDVRDAKRVLDAEVLRRMDDRATWTLEAGEYKLSSSSPTPTVEWQDPEALRDELLFLGLAPDVVDVAFPVVEAVKPRAAGVARLRKLNRPDVDDALDRHATRVDRPRRVTVKAAR